MTTFRASYLQNHTADEKTDCTIEIRTKSSIKTENEKFRFICTLIKHRNFFLRSDTLYIFVNRRRRSWRNEIESYLSACLLPWSSLKSPLPCGFRMLTSFLHVCHFPMKSQCSHKDLSEVVLPKIVSHVWIVHQFMLSSFL